MSGRMPSRKGRRPATGSRSSAVRPGPGTCGGANTTCTSSSRSSRTSISTTRRFRTGRWTRFASGSTRASTASVSMPSTTTSTTPGCATTRATSARSGNRTTRPSRCNTQIHSKNRPETLVFVERLRALTDAYGARTLIGEIGEAHHPVERLHRLHRSGAVAPGLSYQRPMTLTHEGDSQGGIGVIP